MKAVKYKPENAQLNLILSEYPPPPQMPPAPRTQGETRGKLVAVLKAILAGVLWNLQSRQSALEQAKEKYQSQSSELR